MVNIAQQQIRQRFLPQYPGISALAGSSGKAASSPSHGEKRPPGDVADGRKFLARVNAAGDR
jgi:hypothetical protein